MKRLLSVVAAALLLLPACSVSPADPALVGTDSEPANCADGLPECLRVFGEVDGSRTGTGSCTLYAMTSEGQVAVAASGALELNPGEMVDWVVRVPAHLGSLGWNPVCEPTSEG